MNEITIPSLYLLAGICTYASLTHFCAGLKRPVDLTQIVFAGTSLTVLLFALAHSLTLQTEEIDRYIVALKISLALILVADVLFIWFINLYTGKRSLAVPLGLSVLFVILFFVNLTLPYSLQYDNISGLRKSRLPWGELITLAEGHNSIWYYVGIAGQLAGFAFIFYALGMCQ